MIDATGRSSLLKRKLGLAKGNGHHLNLSWFRLGGGIDIEKSSDDQLDRVIEWLQANESQLGETVASRRGDVEP